MKSTKRVVAVVAGLLLLGAAVVTGFARDVVDTLIALFELLDPATGIVTAIIGVAIGAPIVMILLKIAGKKGKVMGRERHTGVVVAADHEYTRVKLHTPADREYERYFDTDFLWACGVRTVGEELELVFQKAADGSSGMVSMRIAKIGEAPNLTDEELRSLLEGVDLKKIGEAFGSHLRPE